ncbi:hypothetical protein BJX65DRAFT_78800 [Aspergillus insuetus]
MEHMKWLDNVDFQRDNHVEACHALGITNPERPKIRGMNPSATLKPWQPVAIHAITQFMQNPMLKGCILADGVGVGKTWETIGLILHVSLLIEKPGESLGSLPRYLPFSSILILSGDGERGTERFR